MGWAVGYDSNWERDIGYGVPSICDQPGCGKEIDRGLSYVCGSDPKGGDHGCGLYFCEDHRHGALREDRWVDLCDRCCNAKEPYKPTPDTLEWIGWKLTDDSWQRWRDENPDQVAAIKVAIEHTLNPSIAS
jgi:hypothetical protein